MSARHRAPASPTRSPRKPRFDLRGAPAAAVLVLAGFGLTYAAVAPRHWLRGVLLMALAMAIAAVLRVALPTRQAGLLAVRSRLVDAVWYTGVSAAMVVLGLWLRASGRT